MAHWISSKLKAAENLLQQIDQQAAESLGKNEKSISDAQFGLEEAPRSIRAKPLIKEQLRKKTPFIADQGDAHNLHIVPRSNSDVKGDGEAPLPRKNNSNSNLIAELTENDWTELLNTPNIRGVTNGHGGSQTSSLVSGAQTSRKDGKVGNYSRVFNPSPVGGKTERQKSNGVKGSSKLIIGLEKNGGGADVKLNNGEDALPRAPASVIFPDSEAGMGSVSYTSTTDTNNASSMGFINDASDKVGEANQNMDNLERYAGITLVSRNSFSTDTVSASPMDGESNSETDSSLSSDSEVERERSEGRKRRQQILAAKAIAKAIETIKARENRVAKLEGEKLSLEKILEEQTRQQVKEASALQTMTIENMEAVELEKQKHNNTRMEAFARLAKLEAANADLAKSLAIAQKNLEIEVDRITELRQTIYRKEATCEELRRKISQSEQSADKVKSSRQVEFKTEMLETEFSFVTDKVGRLHEQVKILETSIQTIQNEIEVPTDVEIELKGRLSQLTDLLIKKQAQVEMLASQKAMLLLKNEAISKLLHENGSTIDSRNDHELGASWHISTKKLTPLLKERMRTSKQHIGSLVRHLDSIFCAGAVVLKRDWRIRIWVIIYLIFLHLWVAYILSWHSPKSLESGAIISLDNISKIG